MNHSELVVQFMEAFAESKGITLDRLISLEIKVDSLIYKFVDLENKTINTIEELKPNVQPRHR